MAILPEYLKVGSFVRVADWVGRVEDIANGGRFVMVLVSSPKQVYRHNRAEWLEYINSDLIQPATIGEYYTEIAAYIRRMELDIRALKEMGEVE